MSSWQSKIFYKFLRLVVKRKLLPQQIDVINLRKLLEKLAKLNKISKKFKITKTIVNHIPGEWISTADNTNTIIFYLHGGAYFLGSTYTYRHLLTNLAYSTKAKIFAIDYRLAPEHPFPAALEDALTAYKWLIEHFPTHQIIIAGDSAGGGLAISTLLCLRDQPLPLPQAAILLSPWLDLTLTGDSINKNAASDYFISPTLAAQAAKLYLNSTAATHPLVSPLYADLQQLPPIYIQVGSAEMLLTDAMQFTEKAKRSGVNVTLDIWPEMIHGWHFFSSFVPESRDAIASINTFIKCSLVNNKITT